VVATVVVMLPGINLFRLAVTTQVLNAVTLPLVLYYLIQLTSNKELMGEFVNSRFQKYFTIISTVAIFLASVVTLIAVFTS
jgi:Mn2+/Fe2+ NRAMP family transporter